MTGATGWSVCGIDYRAWLEDPAVALPRLLEPHDAVLPRGLRGGAADGRLGRSARRPRGRRRAPAWSM
jgi:hypothetical protein